MPVCARLALATLFACVLVSSSSCRLLGIDGDVPCRTDNDCDPGFVCALTLLCEERTVGVGEGEGAAAEGEGAEGEGEGEGAIGEGEGAIGEGEGAIGEGEGEGAGTALDVFDLQLGLDADVFDAPIGGVAPDTIDFADCASVGGCAIDSVGPGGREVADPHGVALDTTVTLDDPMIVEAVFFLTGVDDAADHPVLNLAGATSSFTVTEVRSTPPATAERLLEVTAGDIHVVRHLGTGMRGWMHLLCAVDGGAGVAGAPGDVVERLQCFMNGDRFAEAPVDDGNGFGGVGPATVTFSMPYAGLVVWSDQAYAATVNFGDDIFVRQAALQELARRRLAQWAGLHVTSSFTRAPITPVAGDAALKDGVEVGPRSLIAGGLSQSPAGTGFFIQWFTPGWPRVSASSSSQPTPSLLLEPARRNLFSQQALQAVFDPLVSGTGTAVCTLIGGEQSPGSTPSEALSCATFSARTIFAPSPTGSSSRVASVFVFDDDDSDFTFAGCLVHLDSDTTTLAGCTLTPVADTDDNSGHWARLVAPVVTGQTINIGVTVATPGGVVRFALPQLEDGETPTAPLFPSGVARADVLRVPLAAPQSSSSLDIKVAASFPRTNGARNLVTVASAGRPTDEARFFVRDGQVVIDATPAPSSAVASDIPLAQGDPRAAFDATLGPERAPTPNGDPCGGAFPGCIVVNGDGAALAGESATLIVIGGDVVDAAAAEGVFTQGAIVKLERAHVVAIGPPSPGPSPSITWTIAPTQQTADALVEADLLGAVPVSAFGVAAIGVFAPDTRWAGAITPPPPAPCGDFAVRAPFAPSAGFSFSARGDCPVLVDNKPFSSDEFLGAADPIVFDALFLADGPAIQGQLVDRVFSYETEDQRVIALDIVRVDVSGLPTVQLRVADGSTVPDTDDGKTYALTPAGGGGWDGWVYVVCAHTPGVEAVPHCLVNMQPPDVSDVHALPVHQAHPREIGGDDDPVGGYPLKNTQAIAMASLWRVQPDAAPTFDAAAADAEVRRRAAHFFGIAAAPDDIVPTFSRPTSATVAVQGDNVMRLIDVARDWPRIQRVSLSPDGTPSPDAGYTGEGAAKNVINATKSPIGGDGLPNGTWRLVGAPTRSSAGSGGNGPRDDDDIVQLNVPPAVSAPEGIEQTILPTTYAAEISGLNPVPFVFSFYFRGTGPSAFVEVGGDRKVSISVTGTVNGRPVCGGCTAVPVATDSTWFRIVAPFTADATEAQNGATVHIDAGGGSDIVFVTAPQLEVGTAATSFIATTANILPTRAADDLRYDIGGPIAFAGRLSVRATLPTLDFGAESVLAALVDRDGVPRPAIDYRPKLPSSAQLLFPDVRAGTINPNAGLSAATTTRVDLAGQWRDSLSTAAQTDGIGATRQVTTPHPTLGAVPAQTLRVGGVDGLGSAGATIDEVTLELDPSFP